MTMVDLRNNLNQRNLSNRRGAAALLILSMMMVFVIVAGVTVDYAYMQMIRTDLRIATDAAAKAGAEALARTENETTATSSAVSVAGQNQVAGQAFNLSQGDVVLGRVSPSNSGKWIFSAGSKPFNAVQINSKVQASTFFGKALNRNFYEPTHEAIAGYQEYDVMLCLDRSGSMCFDMSGEDWSYPPNNPNLNTKLPADIRDYYSPPHPTNSRWAVLSRAVDDFLEVADSLSTQPYVGAITWSADFQMGITPYTVFDDATVDVSLPATSNFRAQMVNVQNSIKNLSKKPMMGGTNLSAGLDLAVAQLTSNKARTLSKKMVILMTDGEWNQGRNPVTAAQDAARKGVVVHTVSMLTNSQVLTTIASITGGKAYTTANEAQLRAAFKELAAGLEVVLVE